MVSAWSVSDTCQICHYVSDTCQIRVRYVSDLSLCVRYVSDTSQNCHSSVHKLMHQGDTVLLLVLAVCASLDYGARDTLDCTLVINTICALRMRATALLDA